MIKIADKTGPFSRTGVDVFDWHQMNRVKPEGYISAYVMGASTRAWRRRVYFSMLKQALWARNDDLAHYALRKCLTFVHKERETLLELNTGLLEPLWDKDKHLKLRNLEHRALKLCRCVLSRREMYRKGYAERSFDPTPISIDLPKTWELAVKTGVGLLDTYSKVDYPWNLPVDEQLIEQAWNFMLDIYTKDMQAKAWGLGKYPHGVKLDDAPEKVIPETMKNLINFMKLEQVVYFMEKYPQMPRDLLQMFRIEYARKGGAFDLKAPPIKN